MRFPLVARRIILLPALGLALALTATACSSSGSSATSSSSSSPASAPASTAAASGSATASSSSSTPAGAAAEISANWEKFFSSSTPTAERVKLLQNGSSFSGAISDFAKLPLASAIGAKVTKVVVSSPTSATVTFNITSSGSSLLSGQTGTSVLQDGIWKVGDSSLCALFKLIPGGSVPAACASS